MKIDLKSFGLGALAAVIITLIIVWNVKTDFEERIEQYEQQKVQYEQRMDQLRTDLEAKEKEAARLSAELVDVQSDIDSLENKLKNLPNVQDDFVDDLTPSELQQFFTKRYEQN